MKEQVERQLEGQIESCLGVYSQSGAGEGDWRLVSEGESRQGDAVAWAIFRDSRDH
jgi:hypothetical protein